MMTSDLWSELRSKWPKGYWDDWLRLPENRRGRAIIRPEVSRTYTFGEHGSSQGQFYSELLKPIQLNDAQHAVDWAKKDLSSELDKSHYDTALTADVLGAAPTDANTIMNMRPVTELKPVGQPVPQGWFTSPLHHFLPALWIQHVTLCTYACIIRCNYRLQDRLQPGPALAFVRVSCKEA